MKTRIQSQGSAAVGSNCTTTQLLFRDPETTLTPAVWLAHLAIIYCARRFAKARTEFAQLKEQKKPPGVSDLVKFQTETHTKKIPDSSVMQDTNLCRSSRSRSYERRLHSKFTTIPGERSATSGQSSNADIPFISMWAHGVGVYTCNPKSSASTGPRTSWCILPE